MRISTSVFNAWRFIGSLFLCCILLIIGARLLGHALPISADQSALARNSCALPCFFGVTPGKTTRAQALEILAQSLDPSQVNAASISFLLMDNQGRRSLASINFNGSGIVESVRMIGIDPFANTGTLGDILRIGQKLTHIFHTCNNLLPVRFLLTFGARNELLIEVTPRNILSPTTPITLFDLSAPASRSLYDATLSFGCAVETSWHGLAPLWKYFTHDKPAV